jgi:uncharacterized membrane protein (Fun14 family)
MSIESFRPTAATMSDGFFVDILIGYALKKIIKLVAIITGIFLARLAYLQQQQIANINWNKLQTVLECTITTVSNALTQIPGVSSDGHGAAATASPLAMTNFGILLTGSMSAGFTIGFMKG